MIRLQQTSEACPEQYNAFDESGRQVGYLRLRHGRFSVRVPDSRGREVYTASPDGDGCFTSEEVERYLAEACRAIEMSLTVPDAVIGG
jgi:hypothetical protein